MGPDLPVDLEAFAPDGWGMVGPVKGPERTCPRASGCFRESTARPGPRRPRDPAAGRRPTESRDVQGP